ncbi:ABC transporter substrate-binding protein [Microbacterium sp.]|uniref:ABC transporter substrate-binding protein n=1 Tax=Microbacterium sp. TaxID=51671 RepID=UPI003C73E61D
MTSTHLRGAAMMATGALAAVALTACGTGSPDTGDSADPADYVSGGTFTVALNDDPGNLSPLTGSSLVQRALVPYAYESLAFTTEDGEFVPWLAESWEETATSITYTIKDGITCADGSPFTAETVANNIAYQAGAENGTFWHGSNITPGMSATADGDTVTITSDTNNPFMLSSTGAVEMVCQSGLDDPDSLADATDGTGLFALTSASPGSEYEYTKRDDYTWGPEDITSDTVGLPDTIVGKVVADESTAANLLLSGDLNAASIAGTDATRLDAAGLASKGVPNPIGQMLFNMRPDRASSELAVRKALRLALDRETIGELVTDGKYQESTSLIFQSPYLCTAGGPKWTLPDVDVDQAATILDDAGWELGADGKRERDGKPLTIRFLYDAGTPSHGAAAEEVQAEWNEIGVTTELVAEDPAGWAQDIWTVYNWDTGFIQINPSTPVVLSLFYFGDFAENGGYNFQGSDNAAYKELAGEAFQAPDADTACDLWQSAEKVLVDDVESFPLAQADIPVYFSGATAELPGSIQPLTIRMLG